MPEPDANGCSVGSIRHVCGAMAEQVDDLVVERDLLVEVEVAGEERVVDVAIAKVGDQLHELGLDLGEDARHLRRLHLRLEVVEQHVVRLVLRAEALDIAVPQLDVALHQRQEEVEVRGRLRLEPPGADFGRRPRHLRAQLDRHLHRLLVVAPGDADERAVPRVRIEVARLELVEQAADLRVDQHLVREALEQRDVVGPVLEARRRHHRPLVPREQERERVERLVVAEAGLQLSRASATSRSLATSGKGGERDSNPRPPGPQPGALPTELPPPRSRYSVASSTGRRRYPPPTRP